MDLDLAHRLAREKGANTVVCWIARALLWPVFLIYFRFHRTGVGNVPKKGPLLLVANHRSFSDPFFIGICIRRPLRFVAKVELFDKRWKARLLVALGAFPVRRGESDEQAMETARIILEQGGAVGIFPEGTRVRPGPLAQPRSGVGRLALETGAALVPVAIHGTEDIRRGWRIRPRKVRARFGRPLTFPRPVDGPVTPALAREVTARVWPCVALQWEWLGGMPPIRAAAVVGAGSFGTAIAEILARGGASVQLASRTREQAKALATRRANERYLPGTTLSSGVVPKSADELDLDGVELVCLAVPARALPEAMAQSASRLPRDAGLLVLSKGLVAPDGALPTEHVTDAAGGREVACLGGPSHAADLAAGRAGLVVASPHRPFSARIAHLFRAAGLQCELSDDMLGVQLAGCAKNAAALAAGVALSEGPSRAGADVGGVWSECHALACALGAKTETFAGLAGAGDLVATVLAPHSRNRRAGELLADGSTVEAIAGGIGQAAEAIDTVPLLARRMRAAGVEARATGRLAALIEERREDGPAAESLGAGRLEAPIAGTGKPSVAATAAI